MLRRFLEKLFRWRAAVIVAAIAWIAFGAYFAWTATVDLIPDLSEKQILVYTPWPDHLPAEIEAKITRPLSVALERLEGIESIRGSSDVGFSLIYVILSASSQIDVERTRIADAIHETALQLPGDVSPSVAPNGIPTGQIVWYTVEGTNTDLASLRWLQQTVVRPRLQQIQGVAEVSTVGGMDPELQLAIELPKLELLNENLPDLIREIQDSLNRLDALKTTSPTEATDDQRKASGRSEDIVELREIESEIRSLEVVTKAGGRQPLSDICTLRWTTQPRFGAFERDGNEAVAGIVHIASGENPLRVTRGVLRELNRLQSILPLNIRLLPCYDRTPAITDAINTLSQTLIESIVVASLSVIILMHHFRTSLVIIISLIMAVLGAFTSVALVNALHIDSLQLNIMSLAGIAISIGVLVDASIVVAENVTHRLHSTYKDDRVTGDTSAAIIDAVIQVGRPAIFAVLVLIISIAPVFFFSGIDGSLYRPLAWTKVLTLSAAALINVLCVPVLCLIFIRGNIKHENANYFLRSLGCAYQPALRYCIDHPFPLFISLCLLSSFGAAVTGIDWLVRSVALTNLVFMWLVGKTYRSRLIAALVVLLLSLSLQHWVHPLKSTLRLPLNEGMVMDMPITVPRIAIGQAIDDLKTRNMTLCRFPEIEMVTGKTGRAETAFDPAPIDMIESMIEFRSPSLWPKRKLDRYAAEKTAKRLIETLIHEVWINRSPSTDPQSDSVAAETIAEIVDAAMLRFDAVQREMSFQYFQTQKHQIANALALYAVKELLSRPSARNRTISIGNDDLLQLELEKVTEADRLALADRLSVVSVFSFIRSFAMNSRPALQIANDQLEEISERVITSLRSQRDLHILKCVEELNLLLRARTARLWTELICDETFSRYAVVDKELADVWDQKLAARFAAPPADHHTANHVAMPGYSKLPYVDPAPRIQTLLDRLVREVDHELRLTRHSIESLAGAQGELDKALQMPGWANVWTRPIQNRIDMLTSGVSSEIGIGILGDTLEEVVEISERVAALVEQIPGSVNVIADPIRDKDYYRVELKEKLSGELERNLDRHAVLDFCKFIAEGETLASSYLESQSRVKLRLVAGAIADGTSLPIERTLIPRSLVTTDADAVTNTVNASELYFGDVAEIRHEDGPATIKSESGKIRNYVRLNLLDVDVGGWVKDAKLRVSELGLPKGVTIRWTGQFLHGERTRSTMRWVLPVTIGLILLVLYLVFYDIRDAALMILAIPGALAGGAIFQWLMNVPFTFAVGIGYMTCFGMAASTSMIMLVYLREAYENAIRSGVKDDDQLKQAVVEGATKRLRPKLLTEATMVLSLLPLFWMSGVGADIMRPMATPVLGGILVADEIVDLMIPILFYWSRQKEFQHINSLKSEAI